MIKWYTVYWKNGSKTHISGSSIRKAYKFAGIDSCDRLNIDHISDGINSTHYYNRIEKKWEKYKKKILSKEEFLNLSLLYLIFFLGFYDEVKIRLNDGSNDEVIFKRDWAKININDQTGSMIEVVNILVKNLETVKYTILFSAQDEENIVTALSQIVSDPSKGLDFQNNVSLEKIYFKQKIHYPM